MAAPPAEPGPAAAAAGPRRRPVAGEFARGGDRYGLLLLLLVFSYVMSAFTTVRYAGAAETVLFVIALLLALRTSGVARRAVRLIAAIVMIGSVTSIALVIGQSDQAGLGLASLWTAIILLLTVAVILRRVLTMPTVSLQSIFGAVSAYMMIGLMFAACYAAMSRLGPGPFFAGGAPANARTFQYFSFTTLTTLGYGDFTAAGNGGRAVAVMEALGGQIFLATLVARLVATYRAPRGHEPAATADGGADRGRHATRHERGTGQRASRPAMAKWRTGRRSDGG